jgi:hypothetical protein
MNKRELNTVIYCGVAAIVLGLGGLAAQAGSVVTVAATTDIWLAGQPAGAGVTGYFGTDYAPGNSPVAISINGGDSLTFSITGYVPVSVDTSCFDSNADAGACYGDEFTFSPGPANGISLADLPAGALVGVFVAAGGPSGGAPDALNFSNPGGSDYLGTDFTSLSPELDQLFFIGDGLTGTGTGTVQDFIAPSGAGTLYLAVADSVGASTGNLGSITADVDGSTASTVTPEPSSFLLLASGLAGLAGMVRTRCKVRT